MKHWLRDSSLRTLARQVGVLATGQAASAVLNLGVLVLTARELGVEAFGVLVLIQVYVRFVDALFNFQSWQALIKFGSDDLTHDRPEAFTRLIKANFLLDAVTAALATAIAIAGLFFIAPWYGLDRAATWAAMGYCLMILVNVGGTSMGLLRLFGRFRSQATAQAAAGAIKLAGVAVAAALAAPFWAYVAAWAVGDAAVSLCMAAAAWVGLRQRGMSDFWRRPLAGVRREHPGLLRFLLMTNVNSAIKLAAREVDTLLLGAVIGPAAAGLLRVAKQLTRTLSQVAIPIDQATYPELARHWARQDYAGFRRVAIRVGVITGMLGVVALLGFVVVGRPVLVLVFGPEYEVAYLPTILFMISTAVFLFGITLPLILTTMAELNALFWVQIVSNGVYLALLPVLVGLWAVEGAAVTQILFHVLLLSLMLVVAVRRWPSPASPASPPAAQPIPGTLP